MRPQLHQERAPESEDTVEDNGVRTSTIPEDHEEETKREKCNVPNPETMRDTIATIKMKTYMSKTIKTAITRSNSMNTPSTHVVGRGSPYRQAVRNGSRGRKCADDRASQPKVTLGNRNVDNDVHT